MKKVYMQVTMDKYELPVAVADTIVELSKMTGASENTISSTISHCKRPDNTHKRSKYVKVLLDED